MVLHSSESGLWQSQQATNCAVEGEPARPPSDNAERHRHPGYVDGPAVGNGQFDNARHEEKSRRGNPCGKAEKEENGKNNSCSERQQLPGSGLLGDVWSRCAAARPRDQSPSL